MYICFIYFCLCILMVCLLHWTGATQTAGQQDSRGDRRVWHNRLALAEASEQARHGETWGDTAWKLGRVASAMVCWSDTMLGIGMFCFDSSRFLISLERVEALGNLGVVWETWENCDFMVCTSSAATKNMSLGHMTSMTLIRGELFHIFHVHSVVSMFARQPSCARGGKALCWMFPLISLEHEIFHSILLQPLPLSLLAPGSCLIISVEYLLGIHSIRI